ncbi:MAG: hypothetical protein ACRCST_00670 [Turicibacter sp.]
MIKIEERPQLWYQPGRQSSTVDYQQDRYRIFIPNKSTQVLWNTGCPDFFQKIYEIACYDVKHGSYNHAVYHKTSVKESIKRAKTFDKSERNPKMEFICYLD